MERIVDGRCTGKTRRLLEAAKEQGATVVCSNPSSFADKALQYGIVGLKFISYSDFLEGAYEPEENAVMIDELEGLLERFSSYEPVCRILGYTLSVGD